MREVSSRRRFLAITAAASSLAVATMPAAASQSLDDSELLQLEKEIFAARDAAKVYDDEVIRVWEIVQAEMERLDNEVAAGRSYLTQMQRWALVTAMPESKEYERLADLQQPHQTRQDALTTQLFSTPAQTEEGRAAKVAVLLGTLMDDDWLYCDDNSDYPIRLARQLLIEFVGGKPGEQLRSQFA